MMYLTANEAKLLKALIKHGKEGIIGMDNWEKETGLTIHELRDVADSLERKGLCRVYLSLAKRPQSQITSGSEGEEAVKDGGE